MPSHGLDGEDDKPCRACTDFRSWAKQQGKSTTSTGVGSKKQMQGGAGSGDGKDCPLDKSELGRCTWGFLHTMAAYYPERASPQQAAGMNHFLNIFAQFYPCEPCAKDLQDDMKTNPPKTDTREDLARWLCDRHNTVNVKLGKPIYDCSKLNERWKDGWLDGSCD